MQVIRLVKFKASFNPFAALKAGAFFAAIWIVSPVAGFLPCLAALYLDSNVPKPATLTLTPSFIPPVTPSNTASTAFLASACDNPTAAATALAKSSLFIRIRFLY